MGVIDVGNDAIDRSTYKDGSYTRIDKQNPANDSGTITSFELYFVSGYDGTGVKVGTFSGSSNSWDDRDYESIGSVTSGSKQTFSGLDCDVETDDIIGCHITGGRIEATNSGGSAGYKAGDQFGSGAQTYTAASWKISVYGIGATPATGWRQQLFMVS